MHRLLRKDVAVFRPRDRALVALVWVLGALQTVRYDPAYLWFGVMLAGALAVMVPVVEWRLDAERMVGSLPVPRSTVVSARYVSAVLACAVAWIAWAVTGHLLAPLLLQGRAGPAVWATLEGALTFAVLCGVLLASFLPLYFRLGLGRAVLAFAALGVGLYLIAAVVAGAAGFHPGPAGADSGSVGMVGVFPAPGTALRLGIGRLLARTGSAGGLVVVVVGVSLLLAASARASVRLFSTREL